VFLLLLIYLSGFWGQAARLLPAPFDQWHDVYTRLFFEAWYGGIADRVSVADALVLFKTVEAYLLGLAIPLAIWCLIGRRASDLGLQTAAAGSGLLGTGLASLAIVPAIIAVAATERPWGSLLYEALELAAMLPEHFFIFGLLTATLLPRRRLARLDRADERPAPTSRGRHWPRLMALNTREAVAIILSALVFVLVHLGISTVEAILALPVGLLFAYVTLFCQSIWPALLAHWGLNLCLMLWTAIQNGWL